MFILASTSPRRSEILSKYEYVFKVVPSSTKELIDLSLSPLENVVNIALEKALVVSKKYPDEIIVSADTIVVLDNEIFNKPIDQADAFSMLRKLSGKTHEVTTAMAIVRNNQVMTFYETSLVTFKKLTDQVINDYIKTNEPMGKAGSYAIQGIGSILIESYKGHSYNIIGLPIDLFRSKLTEFLNFYMV